MFISIFAKIKTLSSKLNIWG